MQKQIFETVVKHLKEQGKPSYLAEESPETGELQDGCECAYRGYGGTKCAVGCLILDEYYTEDLEHSILEPENEALVDALAKSMGLTVTNVLTYLPMLRNMQQVHDRIPPKDWEAAFTFLARMYGVYGVFGFDYSKL
jgi:hypothetical protein